MADPVTQSYYDLFLGPVLPDNRGPSDARAFFRTFNEKSTSNPNGYPRPIASNKLTNNHQKQTQNRKSSSPIVIADSETDSAEEAGKSSLKGSKLSGQIDTGPCQFKALFSKQISGKQTSTRQPQDKAHIKTCKDSARSFLEGPRLDGKTDKGSCQLKALFSMPISGKQHLARQSQVKTFSKKTHSFPLLDPKVVSIQPASDLEQFFLSNTEEPVHSQPEALTIEPMDMIQTGEDGERCATDGSVEDVAEVFSTPRPASPRLTPRSHKKQTEQRTSKGQSGVNQLKHQKQKHTMPLSETKRQSKCARSARKVDVKTKGPRQQINFHKTKRWSQQGKTRVSHRIKLLEEQRNSSQESETIASSPQRNNCRSSTLNDIGSEGGPKSKPPRVYSPGPAIVKSPTLSSRKHKLTEQHKNQSSKIKRQRRSSAGKFMKLQNSHIEKNLDKTASKKKVATRPKTSRSSAQRKETDKPGKKSNMNMVAIKSVKRTGKKMMKSNPTKKACTKKVASTHSKKTITTECPAESPGPHASIFTLSELEHASNSLVPVTDLVTLEEQLHSEPVPPTARGAANHCRLGSIFDSRFHPGGIWKTIVDEG